MLEVRDYDGYGLDDTIATKDGKIYYVNRFITKDPDYTLRQTYLSQGFTDKEERTKRSTNLSPILSE
jgi:hypothetical protein